MKEKCPYTVKATTVDKKSGWSGQKLEVFCQEEKVGEFKRNYFSFGELSFAPFRRGEEWYALCSPEYVALSVMKLPECEIIGGEKEDSWGFCPVEAFVPTFQWDYFEKHDEEEIKKYPKCNHKWLSRDRREKEYDPELWEEDKEIFYENFAFVSGCVWGDDSSWKIELRDISQAHKGIIKPVPEWGYYQLPENLDLRECVHLYAFPEYCDEEDPTEKINAVITLTKPIRLIREKGEFSLEFFD